MDEQIIALYAKGLSQEIVEMFKERYDAEVSNQPDFTRDVFGQRACIGMSKLTA